MQRSIAIYIRVSSRKQDTRSQEPDLERWAEAFADLPVKWYLDKMTGRTMDRPGWKRLDDDLHAGAIAKIVVWRLDLLGRTAAGLTSLFEELQRLGIGFESLRDKVDLSTAAGRLMANVLASVAAYENEVRSERICAGQAVARARGKRWGGSKKGRRLRVTAEQERVIHRLKSDGEAVTAIARATGLSRPTIYSVLASTNAGACVYRHVIMQTKGHIATSMFELWKRKLVPRVSSQAILAIPLAVPI
jgi:DNA invertase Pin-like site-specific DNA recombinase